MLDRSDPLAQLLAQDKRYRLEAYVFVFEALGYAHTVMGLGSERPSEPLPPGMQEAEAEAEAEEGEEPHTPERHLTGQELCEAIRLFALDQFGFMAKTVLNGWGVNTTGDFGEIVFNLIRAGKMRKTPDDRREDFDHVYDFDTALRQGFKIKRGE